MSFRDLFRRRLKARRIEVPKISHASPGEAEAMIDLAYVEEMAPTLARVAVLPAHAVKDCPLWAAMEPHVPASERDTARIEHEVFVFWLVRNALTNALASRPDAKRLLSVYDRSSDEVRRKRLGDEGIAEASKRYDQYAFVWKMMVDGYDSELFGKNCHDPGVVYTQYATNLTSNPVDVADLELRFEAIMLIGQLAVAFEREVEAILADLPPPVEVVTYVI